MEGIGQAFAIAGILFSIGLLGLLRRRNLLFVLLSIEIMLNAAGFAFIAAASQTQTIDGQIMFIFVLTMAAAEVAIALALVLQFYHRFQTLQVHAANTLKG